MERQVESLLRGTQFKQLLENYIRGLRDKYGLKRTEIEVLYYLSHSSGADTTKDISSSLHMNKGHISQTTESLCRRGYLSASRDETDNRVVHFTLTEEARRVTEEIEFAIKKLYQTLFEGISEEDRRTLARIASRMADNIRKILP